MREIIYSNIKEITNSLGIKMIDIIFIMGCIIAVFFVILIIVAIKQMILNSKYKKFMMGSDGRSLEEELRSKIEVMEKLDERIVRIEDSNSTITKRLNESFQKMGLVKYDAFKEMGGKLSFAICLLNDRNDGFIMNSIHSKDGCYNYVKEIIKGESFLPLGDEEAEALEMAKQNGMAQE